MAVNPDEDTEFNDALRKYGIIPPRVEAPPTPSPPSSPDLSVILDENAPSLSTLDALASEAADSDTERTIAAYRAKRIAELSEAAKKARFGDIIPISREDYTREVTEGSKVNEEDDEDELGTGVVCFLYRDADIPCARLAAQLKTLAARFPRTKIVSIVGNKCIENYPDRHLPTLFIYRLGKMTGQVTAWGTDRERTIDELQTILVSMGAILLSDAKAFAASSASAKRPLRADSDSEDDLEDEVDKLASKMQSMKSRSSNAGPTTGMVNSKTSRNIRGRDLVDDDDSDFDL
ncbi:hypothetical protein BOTBODRAFT_28955 [Botryobasidium botryosum FD-172 SS1]|uniref:Phosducin thioredoxin-like domain-containing protein n=1 Tax=Botryobasidium botryosum (strain FD-172 SS1) TaxID=930990 RepID=A0A067MV33_BOTB1|nr:hypothetical protein BOTBODRAFT_28955 [Botryobasidium botryosum FD-172 SS1]